MKLMVLEWKHAPEGKESVIFSQWKWNLYGSCHAAACCGMQWHAVAYCGMLWHAAGHLLQLLKVFWGPVCRLVHLQFKQLGIGNQPVISNLEPYIIFLYIYIKRTIILTIHNKTLFKISVLQYHRGTSLTHTSTVQKILSAVRPLSGDG